MIFNSQSICGAKFTEKSPFYSVQNRSEAAEKYPLERRCIEKRSEDKSEVTCDVTGRFYTKLAHMHTDGAIMLI